MGKNDKRIDVRVDKFTFLKLECLSLITQRSKSKTIMWLIDKEFKKTPGCEDLYYKKINEK